MRVAPAWPDLALVLQEIPGYGETEAPSSGLGLLLPWSPTELRALVHAYGVTEIEIEFFHAARARWSGVTTAEVREALRARLYGKWHHWGPFHGPLAAGDL